MGFDTASVAVHMDNVQHVTYKAGYKGIRAYWVVARAFKITKKLLTSYEFLGQMDDVGLVLLAQAVQRLAESKPDFISPSLKKKVGKLIESLTPKET
jgi:hypothetical protein